jgi:hypothetical protein
VSAALEYLRAPSLDSAPEPHEPFAALGIELASADFMDAFHTDLGPLRDVPVTVAQASVI